MNASITQQFIVIVTYLFFLHSIPCITAADQCEKYTCNHVGQECNFGVHANVGCLDYNSFCNRTSATCVMAAGDGESCKNIRCGKGLLCKNNECEIPRYFKRPGSLCRTDYECVYDTGKFNMHYCDNGVCYGPKIGDSCGSDDYKSCAEGFCFNNICTAYRKEGEVCTVYSFPPLATCDLTTMCNPTSTNPEIWKCMKYKSVPLGAPCWTTQMCAGNTICQNSVCVAYTPSPTYLRRTCTENSNCSMGEYCGCDHDSMKSVCFTWNVPMSDSHVKKSLVYAKCLNLASCYPVNIDIKCILQWCGDEFCDYIEEDDKIPHQFTTLEDRCEYEQLLLFCRERRKLSKGAVAGIVISGALFIGLVIATIFYLRKRMLLSNKKKKNYTHVPENQETELQDKEPTELNNQNLVLA